MLNFLKNFRRNETGAITVDWVALTVALVGLVIALLAINLDPSDPELGTEQIEEE